MKKEKIKSVKQLTELQQQYEARQTKNKTTGKILFCMGGGCIASGASPVKEAMQENLKKHGLEEKFHIVDTGCLGPCSQGPVCVIGNDQTYYQKLTPADTEEIVVSHLQNGETVERLNWVDRENQPIPLLDDIEFFTRQTKIVLRNCGRINPNSIYDFIEVKGYAALAKAITTMTPEEVIEEVKISGLRGRGGAGFPTHTKWTFTRNTENAQKYILCNADEGDPGAYMDRSVLEGDPHTIIEGMAIAAYAIGANKGYVYGRYNLPL